MQPNTKDESRRIIVIDEDQTTHLDIETAITSSSSHSQANDLETGVTDAGELCDSDSRPQYDIAFANQGRQGLDMIKAARDEQRPFQLAFVEMHMSSDWDGPTTIKHIWQIDPDIQVVICTVYSGQDWHDILSPLNNSDSLLILKKPFSPAEMAQLAYVLTEKWILNQQVKTRLHQPATPGKTTSNSPATTAQTTSPHAERQAQQQLRILAAEDSTVNQMMMTIILNRAGHTVDIAKNGIEAVEKVKANPYDIVLMDIQMPSMDGIEATRAIRQAGFDKLPIIAVTANDLQSEKDCCLNAGMNGVVGKPIAPDDFLEMIQQWVHPRQNESTGQQTQAIEADTDLTAQSSSSAEQAAAATDTHDASTTPSKLQGDHQTDSNSELPPFDMKWAMEVVDNDITFLGEMLQTYIDYQPKQINELREATAKGDHETAQRVAHTIKGSSANLGAARTNAVAIEAEKAAKAGDTQALEKHLDQIEKELVILRQTVEEANLL